MRSSRPAARTGRPAGVVGLVVGLLAGLVVLAPVLGRGVVLSYDMVFVPDPPITATVLATDGSVPRAVPTEMVADLLARAVAAAAVQQALLLAVFVVAGWGAARLLQTRCGSAAAAVAYAWNPYVAERLVIGHWSFLLGYAVLPWVAGAALAYRRGDGPLPPLLLWLGGAALAGSTSALIATGTALAVLGVPDVPLRRRPGRSEAGDPSGRVEPRRSGPAGPAALGLVVGFAAVVNASWLVPALARPGGVPSDPAGVPAFAARADTPLGLVGSIATLGGIWNPAAWPAGRNSALAVVAVAGVAAVVALGTSRLLAASGAGLVAAAAGGLLLAAAGAVPVLDGVLTAVVVHVPGGGLLRDGQKFLAPTALAVALAAGHAV
ncbi:MAG TPA: hypothetical protein VEL73_05470, partial [Mycobacteriales bacterium]|nr:hypothetical protein [Mycobacteriales bacterium]